MSYPYTMEGLTRPEFNITAAITDTIADVSAAEGLVVTQDTSAANSVKYATDGSEILGVILQVENGINQGEGLTATIMQKGGYQVPYTGTLAIGDKVVGGGSGKVRKFVSGTDTATPHGRVWEIADATNKYAIVYFD